MVCSKKNTKGKVGADPLVDLQHQLGQLSAELSSVMKSSNIGLPKTVKKNGSNYTYSASNQVAPIG